MQLSRRMVYLMKISTLSITLCAVLLVGFWTLAACTVVAEDGTEFHLFTPAVENGVQEPIEPEEPEEPEPDMAAHVIVQFDDHALAVREVGFSTPISGLVALERTGLDITIAETDFGPAICAIEGVGCPVDDCFCGGDTFWGYNYWADGAWQSHDMGASSTVLGESGAIEGWRWGEWGAAAVPAPQAQAALDGLTWLHARQVITDGSYSGAVNSGLDVLIALGANNQQGNDWRAAPDAPSLVDFTVENGAAYAQSSASEAGKLALALSAAQGCYPDDAPLPTDYFDADTGSMAPEAGPLALAILGTLGLEETLIDAQALDESVAYLLALAQEEGGWEWFPGWEVDTNTTALAIQALRAAGVDADASEIAAAVAVLRAGQNADGGFPYDPLAGGDASSDANSTAYVIQALIAAGEDVHSESWQPEGQSPVDFLLSLQLESGAFAWMPDQDANQLATQQAVPALLGRAVPLHAGTLALCSESGEAAAAE